MKLAPMAAEIPDAMAIPRLMSRTTSALVILIAVSMAGRKYETPP